MVKKSGEKTSWDWLFIPLFTGFLTSQGGCLGLQQFLCGLSIISTWSTKCCDNQNQAPIWEDIILRWNHEESKNEDKNTKNEEHVQKTIAEQDKNNAEERRVG